MSKKMEMKQNQTRKWQDIAAEFFIAREILKMDFKNNEIRDSLTANWEIQYINQDGISIPYTLKFSNGKKIQRLKVPLRFRKSTSTLITELIELGRKNNSENQEKLKSSVSFMISDCEVLNGNPKYEFDDDFIRIMSTPDEYEFPLLKDKMNNIYFLLKQVYNSSEDEYEKLIDLDFEDEIWYFI